MKCTNCNKFYSRSKFLVHIDSCAGGNGSKSRLIMSDESCDESSLIDDTDSDPNYSPDEDECKNETHPTEPRTRLRIIRTPTSSPVREEQRSVALEVEKFIDDWPSPKGLIPAEPSPERETLGLQMDSMMQSITEDEESNNKERDGTLVHLEKETEHENVPSIKDKIKEGGKSKKNWCKYCKTFQTKIGRHLAAKHKELEEVKHYLNAVNEDKKAQITARRSISKALINNSNSEYNKMVANNQVQGNPIPVRVSKISNENNNNKPSTTSHVFCSGCKGLFARRYFAKHTHLCSGGEIEITNENSERNIEKITFEPELDSKYHFLKSRVLNNMNKDKLYSILIQDQLMLEFGRRFLKGHMDLKQKNYVGSKMRSLADIYLRMNSIDNSILSLQDCLQPQNFNTLCQAVQQWSGYNEESGSCQIGSVPRRISRSLKMCSYITVSESLRSKDISCEEQTKVKACHEKFKSLMENDWPIEISCASDKSLKKAKVAKEDKMPDEEDLIKFFEHMSTKIDKAINNLQTTTQILEYNNLTKYILGYLIAFNCRRPSEVAYATLEHYSRVQFSSNSPENEKLAVFTVPATKNDVKVPVIVPYNAQQAINYLIKLRPLLHVQGKYLLGKQNGTPYSGSYIINQCKNEIKLKKPTDFTANGFRHYWATKSQSDPEIKRLMPKFLGHTLATHQKFYELSSNEINLNVIGPLFVAHNKCSTVSDSVGPSNTTVVCEGPSTMDYENNIHENITNNSIININDQLTPTKSYCSSVDTSTPSPLPIRQHNRWITPERKELLEKLPKTILGVEAAKRGQVEKAWRSSKIIRKRHSLQNMRIEVSKYFTSKKRIDTPEKHQYFAQKEGKKRKTEDKN